VAARPAPANATENATQNVTENATLPPELPTPTPGPEPTPDAPHGSPSPTPEESLEPASTNRPASTPPPAIGLREVDNSSLDGGAHGPLVVTVSNAPAGSRVVIVGSDGAETTLAGDTWDTTNETDGYYDVQVRDGNATVASQRVLVQNQHATVGEAVGAAATGTGIVIAGTLATQAASSGLASAASTVASSSTGGFDVLGFVKDLFTDAGSDQLKDKTKDAAAIDRRRRVRSAFAAVAAVILMALLFTFADAGLHWRQILAALPVVGVAAMGILALKFGCEFALAHATNATPRIRLWVTGTLSLAASSLFFSTPFGYTGFVDKAEHSHLDEKKLKRMEGLRALGVLAGTAGYMLPFLLLGLFVHLAIGEAGLLMAVTGFATSSMPIGPLPGKEVWRWRKSAALGVAAFAFLLYIGYATGLAPRALLWGVSIAGVGADYQAMARDMAKAAREMAEADAHATKIHITRTVPVEDVDETRRALEAKKERKH